MGRFLIMLSGARPDILDRCPGEKTRFQSLGWAILITCAMATISMWFALTSALGFNPALSFPIAVVWGFVIMGIDRWLVISMPIDGRRKFVIAIPRVLLALLLGSLISTPIVLRIFESEINNQISIIKAQRENDFLNSQQHSALVAQISQWTKTVSNLQNVIASQGAVQINPESDSEWQTLNKQRAQELTLQAGYYKEWQCQLYGIYKGVKCPKGNGPLAQASENSYNQAVQQVSDLTSQMHARVLALQTSDANSQQVRLQQATSELPAAKAHLAVVTSENDALNNNFANSNEATNGLLIRLQALDQLAGRSPTLNSARILLFLLFLVIECLPVTVKLLLRPGNYERIVRVAESREFHEANRYYRDGTDASGPDFPGHRHEYQDDETDAAITARMARIWRNSPTRVTPSPAWETTRRTEPFDPPATEQPAPSPINSALHRVIDPRKTAGFTQSRRTTRTRGNGTGATSDRDFDDEYDSRDL